MAGQDTLQRTLSDTIELSQELREEGRIDGQVKLYNVEDDSEFESDPELFFDRTLMTNGLREALTILRDSLNGDDPRSTHVLYGPYGSGKSHQMVALYHCFNAPSVAGHWGDGKIEGFADALPESARVISVAMQYRNNEFDYLWEPFFDELDYDPGVGESGGYPDIQDIEAAVGDQTVAVMLDELEDWYETLDDEKEAGNRAFLQSLLEATDMDDLELYTIASVLREGSEVHNILDRELAVQTNMSEQIDKREVLQHRLIDDYDDGEIREIVNSYVDAYEDSDHVDVSGDLRSRMRADYPFHPVLIDALESRYFADEGNQNTRGMIYLFAELLKAFHGDADWEYWGDDDDLDGFRFDRDLITHGDIDVLVFSDELTKINRERTDKCANDVRDRIDREDIEHGRAILNTILLYSLKPSEGEGAEVSEIVMGAYQTGDLISDVYIDLDRLHGKAWHLHKLNGKYAIREGQNPNALIQNAKADVSERAAKGEIGDLVEDIFGSTAYTVGFRSDDIRKVPDDRDVKVLVKDSQWTQAEVENAIKRGGRGREWRNTLVFVHPSGGERIESGTRYIDKARYVEAARLQLADDSLDDEIKASIREMKEREASELEEELELLYGEVIDIDDPLNEFDRAATMELDVYVTAGDELDANNIADAAAADPFDLQGHVWSVVEDLLDRRDEVAIEDVYEQFLREPTYPIPGGPGDVVQATVDALDDKPILARDSSGFRDDLEGSSIDAMLVPEDEVETWTVDDVEADLRQRFGGGTEEIDIGNYQLELADRADIRLEGEALDTIMMAVGRLANQDAYVVVKGTELLEKPEPDATLRDVSDARQLDADDLKERIRDAIEESGRADVESIIGDVRGDSSVYLPAERTTSAAREAVNDFLVDEYLLEAGGRYLDELDYRDPTTVTIVPTVPEHVGDEILEYIEDKDEDEQFTISQVRDRFDSSVTENMVQTFLLANLGRGEDPEFVVGPTDSEDPADWVPGYPFKVPGEAGWRFEFHGDDVAELRRQWRDRAESTGEVSYGDVSFRLPGREGVPGALQGTADVKRTDVSLTLDGGQTYTRVQDLFENIPEDASNFTVEISFE